MQINTTKTGERLKLTKREADTLTAARSICGQLARFGLGELSACEEEAHDGIRDVFMQLDKLSGAEPAAKGEK